MFIFRIKEINISNFFINYIFFAGRFVYSSTAGTLRVPIVHPCRVFGRGYLPYVVVWSPALRQSDFRHDRCHGKLSLEVDVEISLPCCTLSELLLLCLCPSWLSCCYLKKIINIVVRARLFMPLLLMILLFIFLMSLFLLLIFNIVHCVLILCNFNIVIVYVVYLF